MDTSSRPLVDVGDVIADRYRIDRVFGQGAMGFVVAATHIELRKPRAIKFMLPTAIQSRDNVERFLREARTASELKSQHAVKIHDVGRLPTGEPYIVMEFLEGTDFKDLLQARRILPIPEAVSYLLQACEAIAEAHTAGIVHRDLKPANLFLTTGVGGVPCVKVLDFGIAKLGETHASPDEVQLTATHMVMGSPLYMSPEQIVATKSVDGRSDIWSLGVILYRMVTGELPFRGESAQTVFAAVQRDEPPAPSLWKNDLPPNLERIILRCLEKQPARRYATIADFAADLAPFAPEAARVSLGNVRKPVDLSDTQLPTQVWRSSTGSTPNLGNGQPSSGPQAATFSSNATYVMPGGSASAPRGALSDSSAPAAATHSPVVQSIVTTTSSNRRGRELFLAGFGFVFALLLVALFMFVNRTGASTDTKASAAETPPPTNSALPAAAALGPAPEASATSAKSVSTAALRSSAAVKQASAPPATTPAATTPTTTTNPVKGPPVRRRDD